MPLSIDQVARVAHLARVETAPEELAAIGKALDQIFSLIEAMQTADTRGVLPMAHAQAEHQRLRPDVVTEKNERETFLSLAPDAESGLFLVPKVIE